jgi:transposase-like protein
LPRPTRVYVIEDRRRLGRIRLRRIPDASAETLLTFVHDVVEARSRVHTDGWPSYEGLRRLGYKHQVTFLQGQVGTPSQLLPHVHRVVSLLKRWLLGTHHGAATHEHLDYYLDEFTFRFNRRRSGSRGKLFTAWRNRPSPSPPAPYESLVKYARMP